MLPFHPQFYHNISYIMGNRKSKVAVSPTDIASSKLRIRSNKRQFTNGRILIGSPSSGIMIYSDGSYLCGRFIESDSFGYCVYRDIAGRLIYTGYMERTQYQGWGAIWNETGDWPEHITFWSTSFPGNRLLRILNSSGEKGSWISYSNGKPEPIGDPISLPPECVSIFHSISDVSSKNNDITEFIFSKIIDLYTKTRVLSEGSSFTSLSLASSST